VTHFFNQLELVTSDEMATSDLDLLVEAERRFLLDPPTAKLLAEARSRGFVSPAASRPVSAWMTLYLGSDDSATELDEANVVRMAATATEQMCARGGLGQAKVSVTTCGVSVVLLHGADTQAASNTELVIPLSHVSHIGIITASSSVVTLVTARNVVHGFQCDGAQQALSFVGMIQQLMEGPSTARPGPATSQPDVKVVSISGFDGSLGVELSTVDPACTTGVFVSAVESGSPADTAGLEMGSQLLEVDGHNTVQATVAHVVQLMQAASQRAGMVTLLVSMETEEFYRRKALVSPPAVRFRPLK